MYFMTNVIEIDGKLAIVLPSDVVASMKLKVDDSVTLGPVTEGYVLTTLSPDALQQLKIGRKVMRKRRDVLRELAKS